MGKAVMGAVVVDVAGGQIGSQALDPATVVQGERVTHLVYDVRR